MGPWRQSATGFFFIFWEWNTLHILEYQSKESLFVYVENTKLLKPERNFFGSWNWKIHWENWL